MKIAQTEHTELPRNAVTTCKSNLRASGVPTQRREYRRIEAITDLGIQDDGLTYKMTTYPNGLRGAAQAAMLFPAESARVPCKLTYQQGKRLGQVWHTHTGMRAN